MATPDATQRAEAEHDAAKRALFDLRTILGGMFLLYGAYLTIRGLTDSQAAIDQAAGIRINLWTGLGALAAGAAFLTWARLRPLSVEEIEEGTDDEPDGGHR
jgi:hypothetical protein